MKSQVKTKIISQDSIIFVSVKNFKLPLNVINLLGYTKLFFSLKYNEVNLIKFLSKE
jgi:hypothetical protein